MWLIARLYKVGFRRIFVLRSLRSIGSFGLKPGIRRAIYEWPRPGLTAVRFTALELSEGGQSGPSFFVIR